MKCTVVTGVIVAVMIALVSVSTDGAQRKGSGGQAEQLPSGQGDPAVTRDRMRDEERDRRQDPMKLGDGEIYGHELMSRQELDQYRKELAKQTTAEERARYQYEHEERMRERAMQQGKDLVPPGQGPVYGGKLMSVEERNQYRETLRRIQSNAERAQFEVRHREEMRKRADALQIEIEEAE